MALSAEKRILVSADGGIATVIVSNPQRLNAITLQMWRELATAFQEISVDDSIRVVVVRGSGERAFVAGADITEFEDRRQTGDAVAAYDTAVAASLHEIAACPKPVVAAISGFCIGAGVEIAVRCDIRLADETATFAIPAVRIGLGFPADEIERVRQVIGHGATADLLLTGRRIDAHEALRVGFVQRCVARGEFEDAVAAECRRIAENAPIAVRAVKLALRELAKPECERDLSAAAAAALRCAGSKDYEEGRIAFAEKRRPQFTGE